MKKIGFVVPWFRENIMGGAEMELTGLTKHMHEAGIDLEILATCVKDFQSDWNENYFEPGEDMVNGIPVRRFPVRKRSVSAFDDINEKLMQGQRISIYEEKTYLRESVNSMALYKYLEEHREDYYAVVFIPYMFGTTFFGIKPVIDKAIMIPCFHKESYAYFEHFRKRYSKVKGMIFHAQPESDLAHLIYGLSEVNTAVLGEGLDTDIYGDERRFREKYKITSPYFIYSGRKEVNKNVPLLLSHFVQYKKRNNNDLKLVLTGGGDIKIPEAVREDVIDLGFVSVQDKYDAMAGAKFLCQPSVNESFSLVIMESWLCGRPVLVNEACDVTIDFARKTQGGLWFDTYLDFEGAINYFLENEDIASKMGANGKEYVSSNFNWDTIVKNYMDFIKECIEG